MVILSGGVTSGGRSRHLLLDIDGRRNVELLARCGHDRRAPNALRGQPLDHIGFPDVFVDATDLEELFRTFVQGEDPVDRA
jgi:hypothetical protein